MAPAHGIWVPKCEGHQAFTSKMGAIHLIYLGSICEIVTRKVIEIDAAGIHDPKEIAQRAVK